MNKMVSRVLWVIAGALLIVAGMMCLMHPGVALSSASLFLGIAMMFSGIVDIIIFATGHAWMFGAGWFLVDGILTVLLSLFIFGNQWFTTLTLPFIMGMWLLFSGISKFVNSFDLQRLGVRGWGWFTVLGILMAVAGFFSFWDPFIGAMAMAAIIGIILILQGIASIMKGCFAYNPYNRAKIWCFNYNIDHYIL